MGEDREILGLAGIGMPSWVEASSCGLIGVLPDQVKYRWSICADLDGSAKDVNWPNFWAEKNGRERNPE